jgi:HlyD family secretion protein
MIGKYFRDLRRRDMRKRIVIISIILIVIGGAVLGVAVFSRSRNGGIKYKTETASKGDIEALVVATGTLNPVTIVEVGSQLSGKIEKLYVDFNSTVREGEIIAKIDQSSFLTSVEQNKANYHSAIASLEKAKVTLENNKKKYKRALELFEKNLISYEEKESAETQYLSDKADLRSAEARIKEAKSQLDSSKVDLAHTIIKSPIDGIVIDREVSVGQTVAASFQAPVLFQIADDLNKMQVECSVDEADIGKLKEGQKVSFTVDAFPEESFTGVVTQVRYSPEVIENVVTYTTIVEVNNPDLKLRPGMTATVSIVVGEARNALRVPNAALRFTPQLSPAQMSEIFEDTGKGREGDGSRKSGADGQKSGSQGSYPEDKLPALMTADMSLIWVMDENGNPRPVMTKTGVTDNSYTEVIWGNLKEGQQVITGLESGIESSRDSDPMRRGMMMMGPPPPPR